jgi:hypothetical protein
MFWKTSPNSDNWSLAVVDRTTVTEVLPLNCGVDVPDLLPEPQPVIKLTTATATKAERKNDMPETGSERRTGGSALIATS